MAKGYTYILRCNDNTLYVGSTRNITTRLLAHQRGAVKTTKSRRPVVLLYSEKYETYQEARRHELYFKSGTGRDWLRNKLLNKAG